MRRNKYNNIKTNGYDSKKEAKRGAELQLLERAREIVDLQRQVPFVLLESFKGYDGKTEKGVKYFADFAYRRNGVQIVEDVKSVATAKDSTYIIKRKLFKSRYPGIDFREVI